MYSERPPGQTRNNRRENRCSNGFGGATVSESKQSVYKKCVKENEWAFVWKGILIQLVGQFVAYLVTALLFGNYVRIP